LITLICKDKGACRNLIQVAFEKLEIMYSTTTRA